jgi:hypothetical protein
MLDEAGDVVGPAAFADEYDLARIGIGHQREIAVASPIRRLVDGEAREPQPRQLCAFPVSSISNSSCL